MNNSGPRSNSYSKSKLTNWTKFDPFGLEVEAAYKRFDGRIAKKPGFPKVVVLPASEEFIHPCRAGHIVSKLNRIPSEFVEGLRAVFLLQGTKKQLKTWNSSVACFGCYWRSCVFLHALPRVKWGGNLDSNREFFMRDVLIHEIGHHVDNRTHVNSKTREGFANWFAKEHG